MRFVSDNGKTIEFEANEILEGLKFLMLEFFTKAKSIEIKFANGEQEIRHELNLSEEDEGIFVHECVDDLFAAVTPGNTIGIMDSEDALEKLDRPEDDEIDMEIPELGLMINARESHIIKINEHIYLAGDTKALIYDMDDDEDILGLSGQELYAIQKYLEKNTVQLETDDPNDSITAIRLV